MGKTYKDKANYFRFKDRRDSAPAELQEQIDVMDAHDAGYRYGHTRKSVAKDKAIERRAERRNRNRNNPEY